MRITKRSEVVLTEADVIAGLYTGKITSLMSVNIDNIELVNQFNNSIDTNADRIDKLTLFVDNDIAVDLFDGTNQATWLISEEYKEFDIVNWLYDQCKSDAERNRIEEELELFVQHDMYDVLLTLKYLVDLMRKHKVVWGLGRGSSVASYCLFLIGIHKVNSLKYGLDIKEFLKGE